MSELLLDYAFANRNQVLLVEQCLVYTDKTPFTVLSQLCSAYPTFSRTCVAQEAFQTQLARVYEQQQGEAPLMDDLGEESVDKLADEYLAQYDVLHSRQDKPVISLINRLIVQAIKQKASDIHFESNESLFTVRFRVDGVLHTILSLPADKSHAMISRLKVMADLDIAQVRLPQDGRILVSLANTRVDCRLSTLPVSHGERVVLRLLDTRDNELDLAHLGMHQDVLSTLSHVLAEPHGIILVTGPTGAGKTTSLYAALKSLDHSALNIMTAEDPVEYDLPGVSQTPVMPKIGRDFATTLRAMLRQDPDVILVGEIRDAETAQIAVQASLTGHLVLSTLHTNTALGAITRLTDMGVEPFLLSSSVSAVISQRLVRKLCQHCKQPVYDGDTLIHYQAVGCETCLHTGYSGRVGIYELVQVNEAMKRAIHQGASEISLKDYLSSSHRSLRQDGQEKVRLGITTEEEIHRVLSTSQPEGVT